MRVSAADVANVFQDLINGRQTREILPHGLQLYEWQMIESGTSIFHKALKRP